MFYVVQRSGQVGRARAAGFWPFHDVQVDHRGYARRLSPYPIKPASSSVINPPTSPATDEPALTAGHGAGSLGAGSVVATTGFADLKP